MQEEHNAVGVLCRGHHCGITVMCSNTKYIRWILSCSYFPYDVIRTMMSLTDTFFTLCKQFILLLSRYFWRSTLSWCTVHAHTYTQTHTSSYSLVVQEVTKFLIRLSYCLIAFRKQIIHIYPNIHLPAKSLATTFNTVQFFRHTVRILYRCVRVFLFFFQNDVFHIIYNMYMFIYRISECSKKTQQVLRHTCCFFTSIHIFRTGGKWTTTTKTSKERKKPTHAHNDEMKKHAAREEPEMKIRRVNHEQSFEVLEPIHAHSRAYRWWERREWEIAQQRRCGKNVTTESTYYYIVSERRRSRSSSRR